MVLSFLINNEFNSKTNMDGLMKKSFLKYLLCSLVSLMAFNSYALEVFAPITSEVWHCSSTNKIRNDFKITVNNVNQTSIGEYNGVVLNSDEENHYSLSGSQQGDIEKYYSVQLFPAQKINSFRGSPQFVINGRAILYYEEYSNSFIGEARGQALFECRVVIDR